MKCPDCKTREIGRYDHRCIPCAAGRLDMETVNAMLGFPGPRPVTPYSVRVLCQCGGLDPNCECEGSGELTVAPF